MSALKYLLTAFITFAAIPQASDAEDNLPFVIKTYRVQVQYEMWRSGGTYWATEFETNNQADAELMFAALETALEYGYICEILDCGSDWIPRDVRLVVDCEYPYLELIQATQIAPIYNSASLYRSKNKSTR